MSKLWVAVLVLIAAIALGPREAHAERRVALVVGNSKYVHTATLKNPGNDAQDIARTLQNLGFEVTLGLDLDQTTFARTIDRFARALDRADVGLFFYAGHGLQINEKNYLVSTSAKLESEFLVPTETIELDSVIRLMESKAPINLVFLDACRNNPLADSLKRSISAQRRSVNLGRGLAKIEPTGRDTLIAFAAAPGQEAADGTGRNSPFTAGLLKHISVSDVEVSVMLKQVAGDVREATGNAQRPQQVSDMSQTFYFAKADPAVTPSPAAVPAVARKPIGVPADEAAIELAFWQAAMAANNCEAVRAYLGRYPQGTFAELARLHEKQLCGAGTANIAVTPADPKPQPQQPVVAIPPVDSQPKPQTPSVTPRAAPPANATPPRERAKAAIERRRLEAQKRRATGAPPPAEAGRTASRPSDAVGPWERGGFTEGGRRCKTIDIPGLAPRVACD